MRDYSNESFKKEWPNLNQDTELSWELLLIEGKTWWNSIPDESYQVGDIGFWSATTIERNPEVSSSDPFKPEFVAKAIEELYTVTGDLIDEDWADMIAARVSNSSENPFCFVLKGQDYYYWHEPRGPMHPQSIEIQNQTGTSYTDQDGVAQFHRYTDSEKAVWDAMTPKHSTLIYRLLHSQIVGPEELPPSCKRLQILRPEYQNIKNCF